MSATLQEACYENTTAVYMALELSNKQWKVLIGDGHHHRHKTVVAGDIAGLLEQIALIRAKWCVPSEAPVFSCYEAGRDGFWLHRCLLSHGVKNVVVDSSSIKVDQRARRMKTDHLDVKSLHGQLIRYVKGDDDVWRVVHVPSVEDEDRRRLYRERERLINEQGQHTNRIKSLLVLHGIRMELRKDFAEQLDTLCQWDGTPLPAELRDELRREWHRREQVQAQLKDLHELQKVRIEAAVCGEGPEGLIKQLMILKSVGWQSAWSLVMELFGWRHFRNRRELAGCTGLNPSPYNSGDSEREQGISKAGNRRVRRILIELAWLWLRYQPDSALTRWFNERWAGQGKRGRRVGIVAVARRLVIALWKYLETGEIPAGAVLKPAV